jgi:hypothetical protein
VNVFNVCDACGAYRVDKIVDASQDHATCPECGHEHPFIRSPLAIVSGASGSGKTTVLRRIQATMSDFVTLDGDILWGPHFENDARLFFETWLRVCKNVAQAGRPVVLGGAGMGGPGNLESCVERRYFSSLHYVALVCDDAVLAERLRGRPAWRRSGSNEYVDEHVRFNRWFKTRGPLSSPPIDLIDTTTESVDQTTGRVVSWIRSRLSLGLAKPT